MSNFLMLSLAILALVSAFLVARVAVNMGKKLGDINALAGKDSDTAKVANHKRNSGAARNFTPSQY
ncbi:MAG: hypothetical protein RIB59_06885 [Rhodospirillales bacterium]